VGVGDVTKVAGELRAIVAAVEEEIAGGSFDDDVTNAFAFVKEHQAVFIRHALHIAPKAVGGFAHEINPVTLAQVCRINTSIAYHRAGIKPREKKDQQAAAELENKA
jgi:hypothetical protein